MRSAAGTPRVSNTACSDMNTREGGLRNIGSTHQRAAISQSTNSSNDDAEARDPGPPQHLPDRWPRVAIIRAAFPAPRARTRAVLRMAAIATTKTM